MGTQLKPLDLSPSVMPSLLDINCGSLTTIWMYPYHCIKVPSDEFLLHDLETFALLEQPFLYNYHFFPPLDFDLLEQQVSEEPSSSIKVVPCQHGQTLGHPVFFSSSDQSS